MKFDYNQVMENNYKQDSKKLLKSFISLCNKHNYILILSLSVIITFVFILVMNLQVRLYHDDFGNAALAYGYVVPNVNGTDFKLKDLIEWQVWIYNNWGGRILYAAVINLLLKNGPTLFMVIQALVVELIFIFIYLNSTLNLEKNIKNIVLFFIPFLLYFFLGEVYLVEGVYWASASVLYVWPMLFFIAFIYFYRKYNSDFYNFSKTKKILYYVLLFIFDFLVVFSQEQLSFAFFGMLIIWFFFNHCYNKGMKNKKKTIIDLSLVVLSLIGTMFILLSPGNIKRLENTTQIESNIGFFEKFYNNLPNIFYASTSESLDITIFTLIFLVLFIIFSLTNSIKKIKSNKFFFCPIILIVIWFIFTALKIFLVFSTPIIFLYCFYSVFSLFVISVSNYFSSGKIIHLLLPCSMIMIEYCLILSPSYGGRTTIPYLILLFFYITYLAYEVFSCSKNYVKYVLPILAICSMPVFSNYVLFYKSYKDNAISYDLNDSILKNINVKDNGNIYLFKYPNIECGMMPYYNGYSYINDYMKEYYNISPHTNIIWLEWNDYLKYNSITNNFNNTIHAFGIYGFEENFGWWAMCNSAFYCNAKESISICLVNPFGWDDEISLLVNGEQCKTVILKSGTMQTIELKAYNGLNLVEIKNSKFQAPGTNGDSRELAIIISNIIIN